MTAHTGDPIEQFRAAMANAGLTPPDVIEGDGTRHRFDADGRRGKKTGWYTLYLDGTPAGNFGCWRTLPEGMNWCSQSRQDMTESEWQAHRDRMATLKAQREQEAIERHAEAASVSVTLWNASRECQDGEHPYLLAKGIKPYGLHVTTTNAGPRLLIPLRVNKELVSLQFIDPDGSKRFKTGGRVQGAYCAIGTAKTIDATVIVCEGYATGASLFESTRYAVAVAFNAGNLLAVAQAIRAKLPDATIIIAADDDHQTPANPGLTKATQAAQAVGGLLAVPDFTFLGDKRPDGATDFNDLHQLDGGGSAAVARCIEQATPPAQSVTGHATRESRVTSRDSAVTRVTGADGLDHLEWLQPESLPQGLPPVPPFDADMLPEALRGWLADIALRMQCPIDFLAVGAVAAISSLVGAKVQICPKERDDWRVTPNLWAMVIGRPGVMKSPALGEVLKPLHRLEAKARESWQVAMQDWQAVEQARAMEQKQREKAAMAKAGKTDTATLAAMLRPDNSDTAPVQQRLIVNDCSVEAVTELLKGSGWGTLMYRDELAGLLESMNRDGQEGARAFYLSAYDGDKSHTIDRIGRGLGMHLPRVCLAMLGGIQPGKLHAIVRSATQGGGGDDGLLQRFQLAVWPDTTAQWENIDQWPDATHRQAANDLFDGLHALPVPEGDAPAWRFSAGALPLFVEWRTEFERRIRGDDLHPAMASHLAKYRKLVPALALLFALIDTPQGSAQGQPGKVEEPELLRALAWSEYLEGHAQRIYAAATLPDTGAALALLKRIQAGQLEEEFTARRVVQKGWALLTSTDTVKSACKTLAEYQWLHREVRRGAGGQGRPSEVWLVNPYVKDSDLQTLAKAA